MITELFASTSGLGYYIMNSMDARKYPEMYSGIILLMAMSALMYAFLELAERVLCRWRYKGSL
jgi:NitT/TauT family transport system permease protein